MEKTGIFYGSSTGNCQIIGYQIRKSIGCCSSDLHDIASATVSELMRYDNLIFGVSTWGDAEMQVDWKDFILSFNNTNLHGKRIALYGLGDQITYSNNFADGMGILYNYLTERNCSLVGLWPTEGYSFQNSKALKNGRFVGLALDEDVQYQQTGIRIKKWLEQLKKEFN